MIEYPLVRRDYTPATFQSSIRPASPEEEARTQRMLKEHEEAMARVIPALRAARTGGLNLSNIHLD